MDGYSRKDQGCPKLLDLIPTEGKWFAQGSQETSSEDQKLVLSLGPPGGEWTIEDRNKTQRITDRDYNSNTLSFNYFSNNNSPCNRNQALGSPWHEHQNKKHVPFLRVEKDSSQTCNIKDVEMHNGEVKKVFLPTPAVSNGCNTAQKRTAPAPVVGWPPVRSFRKNLASSSKTSSDHPNELSSEEKTTTENVPKTLFVKINMDGIPIGRKVDLKAYDSYEKLSYAVDELFRGLRAAQSDHNSGGIGDCEDGVKKIGNLLDGNGEYTLVYEDNEGDRMLVGDVPWLMFVANVKRLRVLKSSELPKLSGGTKHGKLSIS